MKLTHSLFITVMFLLASSLPSFSQENASSVADLESRIYTLINQTRSDLWAEVQARGYDEATVRVNNSEQVVAAIDRGLWPLVAVTELENISLDFNSRCLADGSFSRMDEAVSDPLRVIAGDGGYHAQKAGFRYAVVATPDLGDVEQIAMQLSAQILEQEFSRLAVGEETVLLDQAMKEIGISLTGGQGMVDGHVFYTYILTVSAAKPQSGLGTSSAQGDVLANEALFNPQYYLMQNPDLAEAVGNSREVLLGHWLSFGVDEGRVASPVFQVRYYLQLNYDIRSAYGEDYAMAMRHWLSFGIKEGRVASAEFNPKVYLAKNKDVATVYGRDYQSATWHYLLLGIDEGR